MLFRSEARKIGVAVGDDLDELLALLREAALVGEPARDLEGVTLRREGGVDTPVDRPFEASRAFAFERVHDDERRHLRVLGFVALLASWLAWILGASLPSVVAWAALDRLGFLLGLAWLGSVLEASALHLALEIGRAHV